MHPMVQLHQIEPVCMNTINAYLDPSWLASMWLTQREDMNFDYIHEFIFIANNLSNSLVSNSNLQQSYNI